MRGWMRSAFLATFGTSSLAACTSYESRYEKSVYDYEPIYCYQTIGGVDCHRTPSHRNGGQLVNYYGPAPSKYDPLDAPEENELQAPPRTAVAYRDPEPVPGNSDTAAPARDPSRPDGGRTTTSSEESEWKDWLPVLSVVFGALQVGAAFLF